MLGQLFTMKDPKYATALETAVGGRVSCNKKVSLHYAIGNYCFLSYSVKIN